MKQARHQGMDGTGLHVSVPGAGYPTKAGFQSSAVCFPSELPSRALLATHSMDVSAHFTGPDGLHPLLCPPERGSKRIFLRS